MSEAVSLTKRGAIGVMTVDSPPVNALSAAVRDGLMGLLRSSLGRSRDQGHRAVGRRAHLHRGRRYPRIRQAADRNSAARRFEDVRGLRQADRRRYSRHRIGRRSRGDALLPLPLCGAVGSGRLTGGEARPSAGRRRNATSAPHRRRRDRARPHRQRQLRSGREGQGIGYHRRNRRRPRRRRGCLCRTSGRRGGAASPDSRSRLFGRPGGVRELPEVDRQAGPGLQGALALH